MTTETQNLIAAAIEKCDPPTAYRLAKNMGVSPQAVQQWQNGKTFPGLTSCYRLAEILGKPTQEVCAIIMAEKFQGRPQANFWERLTPRLLPAAVLALIVGGFGSREGLASEGARPGFDPLYIMRTALTYIAALRRRRCAARLPAAV